MRLSHIDFAVATLIMLSTTPVKAEQREIVWFRSDYAPGSIVAGPDKDKGYLDVLMTTLGRRMPQYRHSWVTAPMMRREEEIRTRDNACSPGFLKTPERERTFLFSDAMFQLLPPGLTINKDSLPRFQRFVDAEGRLRLGDILNNDDPVIAVAAGRSYGAGLDLILKSTDNRGKVSDIVAADLFSTTVRKLGERRDIDGVMGFSVELSYAVRSLGLNAESYYFLPLAEETRIITSYIICSPTPLGRRIIDDINAVYAVPEIKADVRSSYRSWLPPESAVRFDTLRSTPNAP